VPNDQFQAFVRPLMWVAALGFLLGFSSYTAADLMDGPERRPSASAFVSAR
jgi:hypothetical protein